MRAADWLRAMHPEHLAPCYGFVQIDSHEYTPALLRIRYWRPVESGGWEFAVSCGRQPALQRAARDFVRRVRRFPGRQP